MISITRRCLLFRRVTTLGGSDVVGYSSCLSTSSTLCTSLRFARPTFAEVTEDLNLLGVTLDESPADLKKKYRELVRKHHPDAGGDEATMSKITVAYDRLSGLSNREKEEFKAQRRAYRGGTGSFGRPGGGGNMYSQAQRTYAGNPTQRPAYDSYGSTSHGWGQDGADFSREYARGNARATYQYNRAQSYGENPFRNHDTVNLNQALKYVVRMPLNSLMIRGLLAYFVVSIIFAIVYRRYRDYRHEEGWKASESLARHEQLERLHQLRQELQQRVERSRDGQNVKRWEDFERSRELRVQEYAQKRQLDAQAQEAELSSWPRFDDTHGSLVKRPYDPPGITYFEPGAANERKRQISLSYGESRRERMKREQEQQQQQRDGMNVVSSTSASSSAQPQAQQSQQGPMIVAAGQDGSYQILSTGNGGGDQAPKVIHRNELPPENVSGVRAYVNTRDVTPQEQNTLENVISTILRGPTTQRM